MSGKGFAPGSGGMSQFFDPNNQALMGMAQGLLQSSGASPRPISFGEAMGNGLQGMQQGYMQGQNMQLRQQAMQMQEAEAQMKQDELKRRLADQEAMRQVLGKFQGGGSRKEMSNALISSGVPALVEYGIKIAPKVKMTKDGYDSSGRPVVHNIFDSGETESTGISPAARLMQVNQGSQIGLLDPYTGQARGALGVGMSPGEGARLAQSERQFQQSHGLAQQAAQLNLLRAQQELDPAFQAQKQAMISGAKETAVNQAKAAQDLPNVVMQAETTSKLVDNLLAHPGFKISVGKSAPVGKAMSMYPGTDAASFDIALNQLKGKQFLEAFESLKGGGQITQIEGEKATQAISRMEKANSEEEFIKASREFQGILRNGINRAKLRAGQQVQQQPLQPAAPQTDGFSIRRLD